MYEDQEARTSARAASKRVESWQRVQIASRRDQPRLINVGQFKDHFEAVNIDVLLHHDLSVHYSFH